MTEPTPQPQPDAENDEDPRVVIIGPNGMAISGGKQSATDADEEGDDDERHVTDLVEQPAKVMRIGSMIRQLLDEVKAAPLDEASRTRLAAIYDSSINELKSGLAPELIEELERMSSPFTSETPSESELRIAQAQVVGWLEGLFHGIQTAIYAQQMAARAQLEQMRRALPPGLAQAMEQGQGQPGGPQPGEGEPHRSGGMYL
jgi:Protein of unknown function (DUF2587)